MSSSYINFPDIDPVIFTLGPLSVHWYGAMYAVAFMIAHWMANRAAARPGSGWTTQQAGDLVFAGFIGVLLGGRIGYVLFYGMEKFLADPVYLFRLWEGGMSFHGGLIGVLLCMAWFARKYRISYLALGDFVAPLIPLGLAAGRLGNFINAELWGRPTDVPWAVLFPNAGSLPRHPSQLYEFALEGVVLFIVILLYRRVNPPVGSLGGVFLAGYGSARFFVEFYREPDAHMGFLSLGMTMGQWLSLPMIIAGVSILIYAHTAKKQVRNNETVS